MCNSLELRNEIGGVHSPPVPAESGVFPRTSQYGGDHPSSNVGELTGAAD